MLHGVLGGTSSRKRSVSVIPDYSDVAGIEPRTDNLASTPASTRGVLHSSDGGTIKEGTFGLEVV